MVTLESASAPEVPPSSVVVTEYEVDCGAAIKRFDLLAFDGEYYPMNYIADGTDLSNSNWPRGCVLAKVDPLDPPWAIHQLAVDDSRDGIPADGEGGGYADPYASFGNLWYLNHQPLTETYKVHAEGYVLFENRFEWDCSSGMLDADGDCPVEMPVVRVVIIDDKPARRPESW